MPTARPLLFLPAALAVITGGCFITRLKAQVSSKPLKTLSAPAAVAVPPLSAKMTDGSEIFEKVCAACHGMDGGGKAELKTPAIAALPDYYARSQIHGFREGRRGHDPADGQSFLMGMIARQLTPAQADAVVAHLARMPRITPAATAKEQQESDLANGLLLFQERCMECHRYNASGELAFGSPPLIGQQPWYLMEQMRQFKNGRRGTIKGDVNGAKMVLASNFIDGEQMLRDIVAYIISLNPRPEGKPARHGSPFEAAGR